MDLEATEWGFVPSTAAVSEALEALWAPRIEWEMEVPAEAGSDDGTNLVCAWSA